MAQHRINMTANFNEVDAAIKNTISNMRIMTGVANRFGEDGNAGVAKFVKEMQNLDSKSITTRQRLAVMNTLLKEQEMAFNRLNPAARKLYGADWQAAIDNARQKVAAYNKELEGVGVAGLGGSGGGLGAFGITKGMIGYQAVMKGLSLMKQTMQYAINTNMEFEQSNANLAAVLGTTRGEITSLTEQAKHLGATTLYTANQITGLQTELARLGFAQEQIKAMTDDVAKLALATGYDLSSAASLAGSTIRAFNLPASEADRVASALAVSTTKSALTMEKLGTALPYVSASAKQFGFSLEDTLALLGTLADAGFKASQQGMAVRNILNAIANDSSKLSRAMGMPIHSLDDFVKGLKKMKADGANLNDIASIIEVRVSPALSRFADGADRIQELRDALTDCKEQFNAMADEMQNTARGSATLLKSAWDGLMLTFAESNSTLKETLDLLTSLLNKVVEARKFSQGGAAAVSAYTKGVNEDRANQLIDKYGDHDSEYVTEAENKRTRKFRSRLDAMKSFQARYDELRSNYKGGNDQAYFNAIGELDKDIQRRFKVNNLSELVQEIARYEDIVATSNAVIEHFVGKDQEAANTPGEGAGYRDKYSSAGANQLTPSEKYKERIENALDRYQIAIDKAALEYENGMLGDKESNEAKAKYTKKREQAESSLLGAYMDVVAEMRREAASEKTLDSERAKMIALIQEYLPNIKNENLMTADLAKKYAELIDLIEQEKEAERLRLERERQQRGIYNRALNGIESTARGNNIRYADIGVAGFKELINNNQMTDSMMEDAVKKLNEQLKTKGIRWTVQLDLETGTLEKLKSRLDEVFEGIGKGVGGVKNIVGALDSVKSAAENMQDTLRGDADAWEKMMAVMNMAMAPLEAMVTIYEAINALKEVSMMLTAGETAATIADTAAIGAHTGVEVADTAATIADTAATGAHAGVEAADAAATGASASASAADAVAKGAKSVSWIPIVGAALGVAAAAGIAAAIVAANKKTEYHAGGGLVGGPFVPRGTDTLPCMLTPGELILNRAQQTNLAAQLQPAPMRTQVVHVTGKLRGRDIRLSADADNRSRGGSRGYYARVR